MSNFLKASTPLLKQSPVVNPSNPLLFRTMYRSLLRAAKRLDSEVTEGQLQSNSHSPLRSLEVATQEGIHDRAGSLLGREVGKLRFQHLFGSG
jgi:hypothetical protein